MTTVDRPTLADIEKLARRALGPAFIALREEELERAGGPAVSDATSPEPRGFLSFRCTAVSARGAVVGAGSRYGARRQLRDLLRLLAGDGDLFAPTEGIARDMSPPERFQLFSRGYKDGAQATVQRHPTYPDYVRGYTSGFDDASVSRSAFAREVGYDPMAHILRGQDHEVGNG